MENARPTSSAAGSGDRRRTVSGALPDVSQDDLNNLNLDPAAGEAMKFPWSSPSTPTSPLLPPPSGVEGIPISPGKSTAYKKAISGNILAKFSLLRSAEDARPWPKDERDPDAESFKPRKSTDDDGESHSPILPAKTEHTLAAALKPIKTRRRKGSLRKTALLGGRRLGIEGRERKNSLLQRSPTFKPPVAQTFQHLGAAPAPSVSHGFGEDRDPSRLLHRHESDALHQASRSGSNWAEPTAITTAKLSLVTDHEAQQSLLNGTSDLGSPLDLKSPTSQTSYTSTTDDDDVLTFDRPANSYISQQREGVSLKSLASSATGYFPSAASVSESSRRRSSKQSRSSPLSHSMSALASYPEPEPHDYTETEYWGWVILFATWLTFAVGMGSCLEIWSWAWDVGETPYAPPELEDDPTLPIVGYYPALIVLTGVVAWVWVTVAWVGMKYFRHAKIEV